MNTRCNVLLVVRSTLNATELHRWTVFALIWHCWFPVKRNRGKQKSEKRWRGSYVRWVDWQRACGPPDDAAIGFRFRVAATTAASDYSATELRRRWRPAPKRRQATSTKRSTTRSASRRCLIDHATYEKRKNVKRASAWHRDETARSTGLLSGGTLGLAIKSGDVSLARASQRSDGSSQTDELEWLGSLEYQMNASVPWPQPSNRAEAAHGCRRRDEASLYRPNNYEKKNENKF